jgi:RNA polymerase sigma-70 factor (ECF subfamily)
MIRTIEAALVEEKGQGDSVEKELQSLFSRLSRGDMAALKRIYDLCANRLYGLALWQTHRSAEAADVVQEVFLRLANRGSMLASVRHPYRYMLQMTHRIAIDNFRKQKKEVLASEPLIELSQGSNPGTENMWKLESLLSELPAEQREAIYLRFFMGLSFREIAKVTEVTLFTAASRCRLGIKKLRQGFGEKE